MHCVFCLAVQKILKNKLQHSVETLFSGNIRAIILPVNKGFKRGLLGPPWGSTIAAFFESLPAPEAKFPSLSSYHASVRIMLGNVFPHLSASQRHNQCTDFRQVFIPIPHCHHVGIGAIHSF